MPRLTVTLVAHQLHDRGGMERALAELVRATSDQVDYEVVSVSLQDDLRASVRWRRISVPLRPVPALFAAFYAAAGAAARRTRNQIAHHMGALVPNPADIISVQFCHAAFQQLPKADTAAQGGPLRQLNRRADRIMALAAEKHSYQPGRVGILLPASRGVQRELAEHYPGLPSRVIPNAVDASRFKPDAAVREQVRDEIGLDDADVVAAFVGGDWRRKGLELAIRAVGFARSHGVPAAKLVVCGPGDPAQYASVEADAGASGAVYYLGRVPAPERVLAAADLMISPTSYEAFPLAALEGAASGLPIIASRVNGIEELIRDGEQGRVVERRAEAYGAATLELMRDAESRRAMGRAARSRALQYSWSEVATATLESYERTARRG